MSCASLWRRRPGWLSDDDDDEDDDELDESDESLDDESDPDDDEPLDEPDEDDEWSLFARTEATRKSAINKTKRDHKIKETPDP